MAKEKASPQEQLEPYIQDIKEAPDGMDKRLAVLDLYAQILDDEIIDSLSEKGEELYRYLQAGQNALISTMHNCQDKKTVEDIARYIFNITSHEDVLKLLPEKYRLDYVQASQKALIFAMKNGKNQRAVRYMADMLASLTYDPTILEYLPEESCYSYVRHSQDAFISELENPRYPSTTEMIASHLYSSTYSYDVRVALPENDYSEYLQNTETALHEMDQRGILEEIKLHMFMINKLAKVLTPKNQESLFKIFQENTPSQISANPLPKKHKRPQATK